jgi:hypothetical protein
VGVWDRASFRNRCSGAPGDQGSNPLVNFVGWSYTRYGATVASHGPRDLLQERELGRVGWGTVFVDIGIGPIFLSRRKRQMKCGMMGNWCCSDSARCPCLRSHWVNCLAPSCWIGNVLHISWELAMYGASRISFSDHSAHGFRPKLMLSASCTAGCIMWPTAWEVRVCEGLFVLRFRSVYPRLGWGDRRPQWVHPTPLLKLLY